MKQLREHKQEAYEKAIDALARYKFMMFGYWSAIWVHLNQIDQDKEHSPFRALVEVARDIQKKNQEETRRCDRMNDILIECRLCGLRKLRKQKNKYPCPERKTHDWIFIREVNT